MPTYEYLCGKCGKFEELQSIKAPALLECPTCHGPVTRIISGGSGLIFKGSGFYLTDNRSSDYKAKEKADKAPVAAAPAESSGSAAKGEAKPSAPASKPAESSATKPPTTTAPAPSKPAASPASKPSGGEAKPQP
jgi:putative FmdB family regulatory protein